VKAAQLKTIQDALALAGSGPRVPGRLALAEGLIRSGDLAQARVVLDQALAQEPGNVAAARMLKVVSARQGDWVELRKDMERELAGYGGPRHDYDEAHLRLLWGEWPRGWELYESRLLVPGLVGPERQFSQPRWRGEPFPGRTLLLHWEQGFGDTLMFVRYAARVKALGGRVLLLAQPELAGLAATCPGVDQVVTGEDLPPFDLQISLLSLPEVFRTGLDSIPGEIPYLNVPDRVPHRQAIAETLAASAGKTRVGIVWAGSPGHQRDRERSLPAGALAPLGGLPGVAWHSFQLGPASQNPLPGLVSLAPLLADFSDTAYALSGMDLVIAVDTALVHLAGALGIPVLLLSAFGPDFRWLLHRSDSPWYPTVRLYRQPVPGDWATVIGQVLGDLEG
jgi:hypothetical protein